MIIIYILQGSIVISNFKYQKQEKSSWCGAACLSMVYDSFGKKQSQQEIMQDILTNDASMYFLYVKQLPKHACTIGLYSCAVRAIEPLHFIEWCVENDIVLIMSHREKNSPNAHYTLFDKKEENTIYANDPFNPNNFPISIDELRDLWQQNWNLNYGGVAGNTGILISNKPDLFYTDVCTHCGEEFKWIKIPFSISKDILCPNCDKWNMNKS